MKRKRQPRSDRFYTRYPQYNRPTVEIRDLQSVFEPVRVDERDAEFIVAAMNEKALRGA